MIKQMSRLKIGEKAIIDSFPENSEESLRLLSLGILPGDEIEVTSKALFFGPLSLKHCNDTFFAIRRSHASKIFVRVIE
ncbi:ferrous iron transport protein A [Halobacteriovorax marinus]|uniref:FeoA family protein n=1 Tax=Halobacteriovorax marinus TaxID=97084 RepID=UPI0002D2612D|nr:FeoA family protein [Halobacteriovorax marinus]ATH06626.1 ferrous iron transport protein A [Halobacteriovorax marinus]